MVNKGLIPGVSRIEPAYFVSRPFIGQNTFDGTIKVAFKCFEI
jgi:hypothetical protein